MQDTHLHHYEEHLQSSDLLKDIVIGMSDGLTVPFALAAGLSGAVNGNVSLVWIAGIAEIAAGSIAMGLGGYLAGKTDQDHYNSELKNEYWELEHKREVEIEEVRKVFIEWGLSKHTAEEATQEIILEAYKEQLDSFMKLGVYKTADVISINHLTENYPAIRSKFLAEHNNTLQLSQIVQLLRVLLLCLRQHKVEQVKNLK